jgi:hypothetical protein
MVINATFNNISVISWLSGLLVEETGVPGKNRPFHLHVTKLASIHHEENVGPIKLD